MEDHRPISILIWMKQQKAEKDPAEVTIADEESDGGL